MDHFEGSPEHQAGGTHECAEIARTGTTFDRFQDNLRRVGLLHQGQPIRAGSSDAAPGWPGVTKFYEELRERSQRFHHVFAVNSLRVMQRRSA